MPMKSIFAAGSMLQLAQAGADSPIGKVVQLLSDVQAKVIAEGAEAQKTFSEFAEYCDDRSKDLQFAIKTANGESAALKADINKASATIGSLNEKIEKLAGDIAGDNADLDAATKVRAKENADFAAEEKELSEVISMLNRAIGILEREMAKGGAAMVQVKSATSVAQALSVMVQASVLSAADGSRLTALVQQQSNSDDSLTGAPDAAVYEGHSGDIIDVLHDLLDKADEQLADARKKETTARQNFQMLEQSLSDEIKFATKDMDNAKKDLAATSGAKATAEGDLATTTKSLNTDTSSLDELHQVCTKTAQDYEASVKSRGEELKAIAAAKKAITDNTDGATSISYGLNQVSFFQNQDQGAGRSALRFVRELASKDGSAALTQLASRMSAVMQSGARLGDDPFGKVKGLISDMISRLESQQDAEATEKAYCDKELSETNTKKDDKSAEIDKLSTAIDQASARSAALKGEVAELQKNLAKLAASQAEMNQIRQDQAADYAKNKKDMQQGIAGVKLALKILREYYAADGKAHAAAEGAGAGIIGLLEVIESDFTQGLAEIETAEDNAQADFDATSKANEIEKAAREQDVKYKTKESADLDKAVSSDTADRAGVQDELDAVLQYLKSLEKRCIAKPETYAERKRRREAELAGLKEALSILEGEAALLQQGSKKTLRGTRRHVQIA